MVQKSWRIEEVFPRFVTAQMAKGVTEKTVQTYHRHFRSLGYHLDMTMTFEELTNWLKEENIELKQEMDSNPESKARFFPTTGGILRTMKKNVPNVKYIAIDGEGAFVGSAVKFT